MIFVCLHILVMCGFICRCRAFFPTARTLRKVFYMQSTYDSYAIGGNQTNLRTQIFCNIELNSENLEAVGFDMDFTLAQYNEAFDLLAFEGAKRKLFESMQYPKEVLEFTYSSERFRRGLIIDIKRGNFLKVDRHKYVRKAYHGLNELSSAQRKSVYSKEITTFTDSNYVNMDTLFHLIDALLFADIIDLKDKNPSLISKSYNQIYKDVRTAVDTCHKDGSIKDRVMLSPSDYIVYDDSLVRLLVQLRQAGKKVNFKPLNYMIQLQLTFH